MQLPPSVQISLLLIVAFLIGIVMTWLYWRRKQNKAIDHALFDREREIEKLTSEIDLLEIDGVKVSPSEYVRSKKSVIFRKNEKINQLERELDQLQIDGERVSASYYVIKTQKELAHKDEELSDLKRNMGAVPLSEEGESDKAELDQLKAVLNSFTIDGEEVSPQEYIGSKRKEIEELKQEIEQYKTSLEEREQEISKLRQGSGNTDEIPMAGSIDAGVRLVHNGIEMDITEYQDFISKELQTKENFIQEFHNELDLLHMNEDNGKLLSPGDAFSQLKRKLAEKDAEIERLTSDFSLVLDQEDSEEQGSLTPVEAFQRLKQQLADKDSQLANLKEEVEKQAAELDSVKPLSMSPGEAFAAMQNGKTEDSIAESNDEIEALRKELAEKDAKIASFESVFAFIPQPEGDSEHEPVSPEFIFNQLKEEISQRDLEISHFNEELAELDITTPETENRLGLPEALRLIKSEILNKNAEIEELKANTSNSENTDSENEESRTEELASLKTKMEELVSKLEKKDEELGSFTEIFSFLPKSDDPEVEAPNPKVIFDELQRKIDDHKLEINHFNEELAALDIETPETEERVGLPEALRLIKIELQDKDTEINDLKSQLEEVKNQPYEPNEELEAVDMKAFRELEEKLNDKENEIEDLKMKLESQPESGGTETTGDEQEGELAKLRLALEQKDEELAKFTAAFDFLPKTEDPEV
ncbi:MAG: hypothetical protein MRZ79_07605, partial [Bacteroidia bacterium]|nr:hypothetical protein [Bacteroidia bacterium]